MSFRLFIYYCALCGGWAAFLVWSLAQVGRLRSMQSALAQTALIAGLLGVFLAGAVGGLDALLSAARGQRLNRVLVCMGVGLAGGVASGVVGQLLRTYLHFPRFVGWMLVGVVIGGALGVFDLLQARGPSHAARRKLLNGVYGGLLGGSVGGLLFEGLRTMAESRGALALGLVILGLCIGLFIGLAQVILKEAWLRVERGFRPGREVLLTKDVVTIGRAESCDLGLFGDAGVERLHARIRLEGGRYLLADADTPGGTYLNDQRVGGPTPLRSGDMIRVGNNVLRFGERRKQTS